MGRNVYSVKATPTIQAHTKIIQPQQNIRKDILTNLDSHTNSIYK